MTGAALDFLIITAPVVRSGAQSGAHARFRYKSRVLIQNAYTELSADGAVNDISISFDGSAATVSGLPTGYTSYYFQVQAVNAAGASEWGPNNQIAVP